MKGVIALFVLISVAVAINNKVEEKIPILTDAFVNKINRMATTWTASNDQGGISKITAEEARSLLGAKLGPSPNPSPKKTYKGQKIQVPDSFDSRVQWSQCASLTQIRDQSACGSCWAVAAAEVISDRSCIFLKKNITVSALDMLACCTECGDGCDGGYPTSAMQYWVNYGLVSEDCAPYPFPSCDHHIPNSPNPCPSADYNTPNCPTSCVNGRDWDTDLHFASTSYSLSGEDNFKSEVYQNGPIEVAFSVYEDFLAYKSGVYQHTSGNFLGGHAVKLLGWGTENGTPYWLVANSWNNHWGDQGYFKIRRGNDECGIEDSGDTGIPSN